VGGIFTVDGLYLSSAPLAVRVHVVSFTGKSILELRGEWDLSHLKMRLPREKCSPPLVFIHSGKVGGLQCCAMRSKPRSEEGKLQKGREGNE
jgi:hypothetical protein